MNEFERLKSALRAGVISRRDFMTKAMALGATSALISSVSPQALLAAEPKKGGRVRMGLAHGSTADSLDPATFSNETIITIGYGLRNNLTEIGMSDELVPELAEGWSSDDAITWVFELRKDVEFQNGKTFDAEDVVASINHHRGEDSKSAAKEFVSRVDDIKADGKHTVVVTLKEGNADFPYIVSDCHLAIMPANPDGSVDWQTGVGTGGYMLDEFDPGVRTTMKRNPNYFKEGAAHFDEAEVVTIADVVARTNALTTNEVDMIDKCDIKTLDKLEKVPDIRVEETSGVGHYAEPMRCDTAPFDNNDVRMALKYAVNRKALLQTILRGHGYLGNDHPIGKSNPFFASELPQREYDPDKARFHLKKAGLDSLTVSLHCADAAFPGAVDASTLYREQAKEAGITIEVVREPNDGYWTDIWMQKPFCQTFWAGRPTADWMFSLAYAKDAAWNETYWTNERFNDLLIQARAELDTAKRREYYFEMQQIVRDDGGAVIPLFNNFVFAMNRNVQHGPMASNAANDGWKGIERWWFEA